MRSAQSALLIDRDIVGALFFPDNEVLLSDEELESRSNDLQIAAQLVSIDQVKVKILFEDSEGLKLTETPIWAVTNQRVILKHGAEIPIRRIREIKL
jgi:hypothetical protein